MFRQRLGYLFNADSECSELVLGEAGSQETISIVVTVAVASLTVLYASSKM